MAKRPVRDGEAPVPPRPHARAPGPLASVSLAALALGVLGYVGSWRKARRRLQEQQELLAAVVDSASDAVISTDARGRVTLFNPAAERIFGRSASSMLGRSLDVLLPPAQRARHGQQLQGFGESRVTSRAKGFRHVQGLRADGSTLDLDASISQASPRGRKVLTAILRDVTERTRAERALVRSQAELSKLTHQLMAQEKATTRRLAQALHDQLGQTLTAIRLSFDLMPGDDAPPTAWAERARHTGALIDQAIGEVRQVLVDLRPHLLDEKGLAAALDNEVRMRQPALPERVELVLEIEPAAAALRWPPDVEYAAFIVAREALGNALLHADAALVRVLLGGTAGSLSIDVIDDGRGLDGERDFGEPGHLGMVGMRERALAIGARFEVHSADDEGTVVSLRWEASAEGPA